MDQGSTRKRSAVHNFAPTVTKFCVMWEGQALPHDTKFGNSRCEIVGRRVIFIWSLIHGSSWSGLIKVGPERCRCLICMCWFMLIHWKLIFGGMSEWLLINSLWPAEAIWRHRSGSTLPQVMACCLTAPSHYLNQCWFIISGFYMSGTVSSLIISLFVQNISIDRFCITRERQPIARPLGRGLGCRSWVQIWPTFSHCNCCAVCTILSCITAIYRESIVFRTGKCVFGMPIRESYGANYRTKPIPKPLICQCIATHNS